MGEEHLSEDKIRTEIFHLYDYHKYRLSTGQVNPKLDRFSRLIMDLKNPDHPNHTNAVQFFGQKLASVLEKYFIDKDVPFHIAIVPSHEAEKISTGLISIVRHVKQSFAIQNSRNPIVRTKSIPALKMGGDRSPEVHQRSLSVEDKYVPKGSTFLLLDDVSTTKNSMIVCRDMLYGAGAGLVMCLTIGQTALED